MSKRFMLLCLLLAFAILQINFNVYAAHIAEHMPTDEPKSRQIQTKKPQIAKPQTKELQTQVGKGAWTQKKKLIVGCTVAGIATITVGATALGLYKMKPEEINKMAESAYAKLNKAGETIKSIGVGLGNAVSTAKTKLTNVFATFYLKKIAQKEPDKDIAEATEDAKKDADENANKIIAIIENGINTYLEKDKTLSPEAKTFIKASVLADILNLITNKTIDIVLRGDNLDERKLEEFIEQAKQRFNKPSTPAPITETKLEPEEETPTPQAVPEKTNQKNLEPKTKTNVITSSPQYAQQTTFSILDWFSKKNRLLKKTYNHSLQQSDVADFLTIIKKIGVDELNKIKINDHNPILYSIVESIFLGDKTVNEHIFKELLKIPGIDVNVQNSDGKTPLHLAIYRCDSNIIEILLDRQDIVVTTQDLDAAKKVGHDAKIIRKMKSILYKNETSLRVLIGLEQKSSLSDSDLIIIRNFIENTSIDILNKTRDEKTNNTLLHLATLNGHTEVFRMLIDKGGIYVNAKNVWGDTPLHMASYMDHDNELKILIKDKSIDVNATNIWDETPLRVAILNDSKKVVKELLQSSNTKVTKEDLDIAQEHNFPDEIINLLKHRPASGLLKFFS